MCEAMARFESSMTNETFNAQLSDGIFMKCRMARCGWQCVLCDKGGDQFHCDSDAHAKAIEKYVAENPGSNTASRIAALALAAQAGDDDNDDDSDDDEGDILQQAPAVRQRVQRQEALAKRVKEREIEERRLSYLRQRTAKKAQNDRAKQALTTSRFEQGVHPARHLADSSKRASIAHGKRNGVNDKTESVEAKQKATADAVHKEPKHSKGSKRAAKAVPGGVTPHHGGPPGFAQGATRPQGLKRLKVEQPESDDQGPHGVEEPVTSASRLYFEKVLVTKPKAAARAAIRADAATQPVNPKLQEIRPGVRASKKSQI